MAIRSRYVAPLLVPLCLLVGCGDESGDSADDPAPSGDSSETSETTEATSSAPHPCDVLTRVEVQGTLDALVKAVPVDDADGRQCVYEPGADAPAIRLIELPTGTDLDTVLTLESDDGTPDMTSLEVEGLSAAFLGPGADGAVTAYGQSDSGSYQLEVEAGGLGDPARIAERLLSLIGN